MAGVTALLSCTSAAWALAPVGEDKDPVETRVEAHAKSAPLAGPPAPIRVGDFILHPTASIALGHTDNALLDDSKLADRRWDLALGARLQSDWKRHALTASLQHSARRHFEHKTEDRDLSSGNLEGRYDLADAWHALAFAKFDDAVVSKANPNRVPGVSQQKTRTTTYAAQLQNEGARYWGHLLFSHEVSDSESVLRGPGIDLSDLLDSKRNDLAFFPGLRIGADRDRLFAILTATETRFDAPDPAVRGRNMDGHHLGVGFARQTASTTLEARVWHFDYRFADPGLDNVKGVQAYVSGTWRIGPQWGVNGRAMRSFEPTTIPGSPGQYVNDLAVGAHWALSPLWSIEGNLGRTRYSAVNAPVTGTATAGGLALVRTLGAHLQARLQLSRNKVDSTVATLDYAENAVAVQLMGQW